MSTTVRYVEREDYHPPEFRVEQVELTFELAAERTIVTSRLTLARNPEADMNAALVLDGRDFDLISWSVDGSVLPSDRYQHEEERLIITGVGHRCVLEAVTALEPASNTTQMGLFQAGSCLVTQCEADGFRRMTFFPDRPDVLAPYRVRLEADKATFPVLLSNGDRLETGDLDDDRHYAVWEDPHPKPSYIFAVVAGDLSVLRDDHTTASGRKIELAIYADPAHIGDCGFAMGALQRALAWDEAEYGLEYDLDQYNIVAIDEYTGAMENKGLNLFEAKGILASPSYSTDNDYLVLERILAHEVFHNWTGNRVTCRDWFELSLKEGLTRFRDRQFSEAMSAPGPKRIDAINALRRNQFPEDDGNAAHPVKPERYADVQNLYTATVYEKGAELIRMLYVLLGREAFHRGVDLYLHRHDGCAVTTEEFMGALEEASTRDLSQFRRWYHQKGRPRITVRGRYDEDADRYELEVSQSLANVGAAGEAWAAPMLIPIAIGLLDGDGARIPLRSRGKPMNEAVLELTEPNQTFIFEQVPSRPIPSVLRGLSAPVSADVELTDDDLAVLMAFEVDPYSRWDASQQLATRVVRRLAAGKDIQAAGAGTYIQAFGETLKDKTSDLALLARVLTLPDEPMLSEGLQRVDVDGHAAGRSQLRTVLAQQYDAQLLASYHEFTDSGPYQPEPQAIARRAYRNLCLELLMALPTDQTRSLCLKQLQQSDNMNDAYMALACLCHIACPERHEAIDLSLRRWIDNPIAMGHWFTAQALSRAADAVDSVIALTQHPEFEVMNPTLAMALYGSFFRQNRTAFHDPSGKGYEFLADTLIAADKLRPSGSFWLMPQINQWRRYDDARQKLMRTALQRIAAAPEISRGLAENVAKALG